MYRIILISLSFVPLSSLALALLEPYDPAQPPSYINASSWPSMPPATLGGLNPFPDQRECQITVYLSSPDFPRARGYRTGQTAKYEGKNSTGANTYSCWGVLLDIPPTAAQSDQILALNTNTKLSYNQNLGGVQNRGHCVVTTTYRFGSKLWSSNVACDIARPPVECNLTNTKEILHGTVPAGALHTTSRGNISIQCSRPTSVTVRVEDATLPLLSGNASIDSKIYIDQIGKIQWKGTVDRNTAIDVISTIDDNTSSAGEYSGSAVITATWD